MIVFLILIGISCIACLFGIAISNVRSQRLNEEFLETYRKYSPTHRKDCRMCGKIYANEDSARLCEDWDHVLGTGRHRVDS